MGRTEPQSEAETEAPPRVDVGILTIRPDEFQAVLDVFRRGKRIYSGSRREYALRTASAGKGQSYTLGILRQGEQGNGEAQDAARDLLDDLQPSLLLVVGIAGGVPSDDFTLGDVVLSTRVMDYSVEARKENEPTSYSLSGGPVARELQARLANLHAHGATLKGWDSSIDAPPGIDLRKRGSVYGPDDWKQRVRQQVGAHFPSGTKASPPRYVAGAIASSDRLVKDPKLLFPWIQTARHLLAVEMESGGVFRAARERCPMLAIRGISDIVGLKRADAWTKYACVTAAAFTRAFLKTTPVPPLPPPAQDLRTTDTKKEEAGARAAAKAAARGMRVFSNLVPLAGYPEKVFVAPATCSSVGHGWGRLKDTAAGAWIPRSWCIHQKNVLSLTDPSGGPLTAIVDRAAIEEHELARWADSADSTDRRLFIRLLNGALRDQLTRDREFSYSHKDDEFFFSGSPDQPPRKRRYRSVARNSTITVVQHYSAKKDDKKHLRHLSFSGRFRRFADEWYLEITPSYRYTNDGFNKVPFNDTALSKMKRLERNQAVRNQILLLAGVLVELSLTQEQSPLLTFGHCLQFEVDPGTLPNLLQSEITS